MSFSFTNRALTPVVGIILLVGLTIVLSAGLSIIVLNLGDDLSDDASAAVELSDIVIDDGEGYAVVTAITTSRTEVINVMAESNGDLEESNGMLTASGESVTIRGSENNTEEIEVEITVLAETSDQSSVIFQRNVTL